MPAEPNTNPTPYASDRVALSYSEVARLTGLSERTIWAACASGELRAARVGRRRLIAVTELQRWLAAKTDGGAR